MKEKNNMKLNLKYEEIKKLFDRYNMYTLDSIDLMLKFAEGYDLDDTNKAFINIYNKKYNEERDNLEGRNEYDYITRLKNFNIDEIIGSMEELSKEELKYLNDLVLAAVYHIKENKIESSMLPKLKEFMVYHDKELINYLKPTIDYLNEDEIKEFFNKYNVSELELFDLIFENTKSYNIKDIKKIKNEVYNDKYAELTNNFEVGVMPKGTSVEKLSLKNKLLNEKELNFFHDLVEDAASYLDSIGEFEDEYKTVCEEFDSGDYPIVAMSNLLDNIENDKKMNFVKKLVKKNKN